jgi:omega-6 fatty acid desaturase (delta-12 desaturase)
MSPRNVPSPSQLTHLRPENLRGGVILLVCVGLTIGGIWTSAASSRWTVWLCGQLVLGLALVQWFAVLHECGHETLFRSRRWHRPVGVVAGFMTLIPFHTWTRIHSRHHKWTGWQDVDPTTAGLAPRTRSRAELAVVNACWRLWIPLFSVVYRITNYWNLRRFAALFPARRDRRAAWRDTASLVAAYGALVWMVGPASLTSIAGLAIFLSFTLEDLLLLSQHTHVPQRLSAGETVRPFPAVDQEPFTRSLRLPRIVSAGLLHFDAHELHHMFPFVPGYHLRRISYSSHGEVGWWRWVATAKRIRGEVLLFQNRNDSGWEI